jgi:cytochrome c biogenesis factor
MASEYVRFVIVEVAVSTIWGGEHLTKIGGAISMCRYYYAEGRNL